MMILSSVLALIASTTEEAPKVDGAVEKDFVECLADKQPALIAKIRDADSQESFVAALKEGDAICPVAQEKMSMGRLFKALGEHKKESAK